MNRHEITNLLRHEMAQYEMNVRNAAQNLQMALHWYELLVPNDDTVRDEFNDTRKSALNEADVVHDWMTGLLKSVRNEGGK